MPNRTSTQGRSDSPTIAAPKCPSWCTKDHVQDVGEFICNDIVHLAELEPTPFGPIMIEHPVMLEGLEVDEPPLMLLPDSDRCEMTIDQALALARAIKVAAARFQAVTA